MINTRNTIIFLAALSLIIHLVPFLIFGPHPLGYDTGFYRRYVIQPFTSFPNTPVPGFGENALTPRIFLDIIRLFKFTPDIILYGGYLFLFIIQPVALFFFVRQRFGNRSGILAAIFLIASPVQYTAYWYMLFKSAFAIPLILITFLMLERNSHLAVPFGILIAFSHHTTGIIFLLTLAVYLILNHKRRALTAAVLTGTMLAFLYLHSDSLPDYLSAPVAVFMGWKEYALLSLPLFLMALWGVKGFFYDNPRSTAVALFIVAAAFPIFFLPFYERIFIFTDIIIVVASALGFKNLLNNMPRSRLTKIKLIHLVLVILLPLWVLLNLYGRIQNLRPLVSGPDLEELENIRQIVPNNAAILTSTPLAPWVQGWSQNRVVAPGMLHDTHTVQEWVSFSIGSREEKIDFLKNFPKPLYVFLIPSEKEKFLENFKDCFREDAPYLSQYICND
ncbi:MAG: hypothetical protein HYT98_02725 [Candidatus Sungbacteria bacterium]|nr:hypothetical protein [Candidatus Sungbacteria bacterium]